MIGDTAKMEFFLRWKMGHYLQIHILYYKFKTEISSQIVESFFYFLIVSEFMAILYSITNEITLTLKMFVCFFTKGEETKLNLSKLYLS